ncbi:inorganic phosphate transporter [Hymenopellis radicata]|nr:inorganic phosphate transporter [Hymenopellis radicata]
MNTGMQNMVISLGAMQVARKIPFDDPDVLNYARIGYVAAQVIILCIYYYVSFAIKKKNDQTVLKYVEAPSPMSQEPGQLVTTTVRDYDLAETSKLVRAMSTSPLLASLRLHWVAMMAFLHGYMKFTQPLFIQSLMGLKGVYDAQLVGIHVFGKKAPERPFKAAPGMFGMASAGPQTDAAAIAAAEKRVETAKKEE